MPNSESPQNRAEWSAVEEGFRLLERDLGKLQVRIRLLGVPLVFLIFLSVAIHRDQRRGLPQDPQKVR
jgi:hypothetical protein